MTMRFSRDIESEFFDRPQSTDPFRGKIDPAPTSDPRTEPLDETPAHLSSVYIPEHYEPNYAYPLVVWVERGESPFHGLHQVVPVISERNYVGLSLQIDPLNAGGEYAEGEFPRPDRTDLEDMLCEQIRELRREIHIHTERIFLAGFGEGASAALEMGLARPEWFAGMACLATRFPAAPLALNRYHDLRGKRVLLAAGLKDRHVPVTETMRTARLLHAAGMKVCTRIHDAGHQVTRPMLREIDRWIMQEIYHPQPVS